MKRLLMLIGLCLLLASCAEPELKAVSEPPKVVASAAALQSGSVQRKAEQMTLRIRNLSCNSLATGSGFAIGKKTLITNHHVVDGAENLEVNTWDGKTLKAKIKSASKYGDIALVEVQDELPFAAELVDGQKGQPVFVVGFPLGEKLTITEGKILDYGYFPNDQVQRMSLSARVLPGNSGGPVFNAEGKVVGAVVEMNTATGMGFAIPSKEVQRLRTSEQAAVTPCQYQYNR